MTHDEIVNLATVLRSKANSEKAAHIAAVLAATLDTEATKHDASWPTGVIAGLSGVVSSFAKSLNAMKKNGVDNEEIGNLARVLSMIFAQGIGTVAASVISGEYQQTVDALSSKGAIQGPAPTPTIRPTDTDPDALTVDVVMAEVNSILGITPNE